jgi:hypothetical protein
MYVNLPLNVWNYLPTKTGQPNLVESHLCT